MTTKNFTSLAGAALIGLAGGPAAAEGLDAYAGKARPVVVFAPARDAPQATEQLKRFTAARAALAERDMPVFVVTLKDVTVLSGERSPATLRSKDLRSVYGVADDAFAVVLVGKDGGEKLRASEPVSADRLMELVDQMPMRRQEAR